ncbi:phosphopentomutase [bacterium]|nr:phosphopentomutase [bacterium]
MRIKRVIIIVLDSVGVGTTPDSYKYGDYNVNTLDHVSSYKKNSLQNLELMGFGNLLPFDSGISHFKYSLANYGKAQEESSGKDSTSGHWEIAGYIKREPFPVYPQGFPDRIINPFKQRIGRDILGNYPASGTTIINDLGEEHMKTGFPIVYTSGDSVFQIAAHEEIVPIETLYRWCEIARSILVGKDLVGRVIARPFIGDKPDNFKRTANRRDFSATPPENTVLDNAKVAGLDVLGIGKIEDLFAGKGLTQAVHTSSNLDGIQKTIKAIQKSLPDHNVDNGIIFTNLVDFDTKYGHRRNVEGYYNSLKEFNEYLPEIIGYMEHDDVLILTADHGNDPTFKGSDHTREYIPIIAYSQSLRRGVDMGTQHFSDIGQTVADILNINRTKNGNSFLKLLKPDTDEINIDISNFNLDFFLFDMGEYREDIFLIMNALRMHENNVNLFVSDHLMKNCTFETGDCLYSTLPENRKEKYENIIIPIVNDGMVYNLLNLNKDDSLYDEVFKMLALRENIVLTYPYEFLNGEMTFSLKQKRRENISELIKLGYKLIPFSKINQEFEKIIRSRT